MRVFVTGIGLVSPLGLSAPASWRALLAGHTAVAPYRHHPSIPVNLAARVPRSEAFPPSDPNANTWSATDLCAFPARAAREALRDAALPNRAPLLRSAIADAVDTASGVALGVCIPHLPDAVAIDAHLHAGRFRRVSPYWVTRVLPSTPAAHLSLTHGLAGPLYAPATACASAGSALHDAAHALRRADAGLMLAGAADASMHALVAAAFARAGALAPGPPSDAPGTFDAPGPFDSARAGFVLGEGAGLLVLESEAQVRRRGARVYAELAGSAVCADSHAMTAPLPDGRGAERVMRAALQNAGVSAEEVDYVNAHATATPTGDVAERAAIARVFARNDRALASSTKGATGHALAAAGALEAVFAVLAVSEGAVPPTVGLRSLDDTRVGAGWDDVDRFVPQRARRMPVDVAISNSLGFGGINTCVVFRAPPPGFKRKRLAALALDESVHDEEAAQVAGR